MRDGSEYGKSGHGYLVIPHLRGISLYFISFHKISSGKPILLKNQKIMSILDQEPSTLDLQH